MMKQYNIEEFLSDETKILNKLFASIKGMFNEEQIYIPSNMKDRVKHLIYLQISLFPESLIDVREMFLIIACNSLMFFNSKISLVIDDDGKIKQTKTLMTLNENQNKSRKLNKELVAIMKTKQEVKK